jgi:hypothetical protein
MHNGLMADPTNPYTIAIKKITSKGSKKITEADHEERNRLEWEAGLYWDDAIGPVIPSDNIERCIQLGAQKSRRGKEVQAAVFCAGGGDIKLSFDGPRDKAKLYSSGKFILRKGVAVQKSRIIRVRPMAPTGWSLEFTLEYDSGVVDEKTIIDACQAAGSLVGLGDWRPKFGRFMVEIL